MPPDPQPRVKVLDAEMAADMIATDEKIQRMYHRPRTKKAVEQLDALEEIKAGHHVVIDKTLPPDELARQVAAVLEGTGFWVVRSETPLGERYRDSVAAHKRLQTELQELAERERAASPLAALSPEKGGE